jgi:hypothetical protein
LETNELRSLQSFHIGKQPKEIHTDFSMLH